MAALVRRCRDDPGVEWRGAGGVQNPRFYVAPDSAVSVDTRLVTTDSFAVFMVARIWLPHRIQIEVPLRRLARHHHVRRGRAELIAQRTHWRIGPVPADDVAHPPRVRLTSVERVAAVGERPAERFGDEGEGLGEGPIGTVVRRATCARHRRPASHSFGRGQGAAET